MDDLSNLRKLVARLDELAIIIEAANDQTIKNIEANNLVVKEMDKAESMALSISQAHEKHIQIIGRMDKIIQDVDHLPIEFKKQSKEALSSIDLQAIKEQIERLLKEELLRLDNSVSLLARINDTFAKSLDYNYKTVRDINKKTEDNLLDFLTASKRSANRAILHFIYGFGFSSLLSIVLYFSVLK